MSNMSYCRFQNTSSDLEDCLQAINDNNIQSIEENKKAKRMIKNFLDFCLDEGIIENYDSEIVDDLIDNSTQDDE